MLKKKDIVEIFGHAPDDLSLSTRSLWNLGACPFLKKSCIKINHDQSIVYGTCSMTSPHGDVIICPNRFYADNYAVLRRAAEDAFGSIPFLLFSEYIEQRGITKKCVVALGKNSGKEIQAGRSLSIDWILARIEGSQLAEYIGLEIQITGNYRDSWHGYKNLPITKKNPEELPSSNHGLNWANVHKRLIPQLIRKEIICSRSSFVKKGLYFILPEVVFKKFKDVVGVDIPRAAEAASDTLTVFTYQLGAAEQAGCHRKLLPARTLRFTLNDFSTRFISGPDLPSGEALDAAVQRVLGPA